MSAASKGALERIHAKLAEAIEEEIDFIIAGTNSEVPVKIEAAFINAVRGFLKDNEITADIKDGDDLAALRRKMTELKSGNLVKDADNLDYLN